MATDVEIANLAASRIGHTTNLTSFSPTGDKYSRWLNSNYEIIKQVTSREFQYRFSVKREVLEANPTYIITGATAANPVVVTSTAHGFSNGDTVFISGVIGMGDINNKTYTAANVTANTFELSGVDGTAYTAYSSAGVAYPYVATEFAYQMTLPADCLRLLRVNEGRDVTYRVEQGFIYTGETVLNIEYTFDETSDANFDANFVDLFAQRLAAESCFYMTGNTQLTELMHQRYEQKARLARTLDSQQSTPRGIEADTWIKARF